MKNHRALVMHSSTRRDISKRKIYYGSINRPSVSTEDGVPVKALGTALLIVPHAEKLARFMPRAPTYTGHSVLRPPQFLQQYRVVPKLDLDTFSSPERVCANQPYSRLTPFSLISSSW